MKIILFTLAFIISTDIYAKNSCIKRIEYIRTYDGDTFFVKIKNSHKVFGEEIGIRVRGIDAAEIRGVFGLVKSQAIKARDYVHTRITKSKSLKICDCEKGKYFRLICDVKLDEKDDLAEELLNKKLVEKY